MSTVSNEKAILDLGKIGIGEQVDGFFIVSHAQDGVASNEKPFLTLKLKNQTGEIEGKLWSCTEEQKEICKLGDIIKVRGTVKEYKNVLQLNILKVRPSLEEDNISIDELAPTAPIDKVKVEEEIIQTILSFDNSELKEIVLQLFKKYRESFLTHVAAKSNHHNEIGGLAYHTSTMLELAKRIAPIYPMVNQSLLYAGVICHDLGKIIELENPIAPSYSLEGSLVGHISIMASEIKEVSNLLIKEGLVSEDSNIPTLLIHLVLSHHGRLEYGSPVEPKTIEAELLHQIDMIDSRMNMIGNALVGVEKGNFVKVNALRREFLSH